MENAKTLEVEWTKKKLNFSTVWKVQFLQRRLNIRRQVESNDVAPLLQS